MYPEFVESFNANLVITFELRDENQAGLPAMRFKRENLGKPKRPGGKNNTHLESLIGAGVSESEEEEEEIGTTHMQCNGFRAYLAPSSFECEDESELDPTYVYCKNINQSKHRKTSPTGILEFSTAKGKIV